MTTPTKTQVLTETRRQVGVYANLAPAQINDAWELKGVQLALDDNLCAYLAETLTDYANDYRADAVINPADTRKAQQTVAGLADIVVKRITA